MKSSVIDVPRKYTEEDLFGINKYQKALCKFIKHTNTPINIEKIIIVERRLLIKITSILRIKKKFS